MEETSVSLIRNFDANEVQTAKNGRSINGRICLKARQKWGGRENVSLTGIFPTRSFDETQRSAGFRRHLGERLRFGEGGENLLARET